MAILVEITDYFRVSKFDNAIIVVIWRWTILFWI